MRWLGMVLAGVMLLVTATVDASQRDGFRGLGWGAELKSLNGGDFTKLLPFKGIPPDLESYQRKNDALALEDAKVESVVYNFKKGKLVSVNLDFNGYDNYERLMSYCKAQYGPATSSMAKNQELISSFESGNSGALIFFQVRAAQFSFGRLFIYSRDWLR